MKGRPGIISCNHRKLTLTKTIRNIKLVLSDQKRGPSEMASGVSGYAIIRYLMAMLCSMAVMYRG